METLSSEELAHFWLERQRHRQEHPEKYSLKSTGLSELDKKLGGGIEAGQYVIIGGAQKSGKTTVMINIAKAYAKQKLNFVWFGAEMNNMQIGNMLFSNVTGIDRTTIRNLQVISQDWERLENAEKEIAKYTGYWNYGFSTIDSIGKIIGEVEALLGKPLDAIFVDYIQLMEAANIKGGRTAEIEFISRQLKRFTLAHSTPLTVFTASQLNRESIRSKLYDANAFLNSGSLERDMDIGLIVRDVVDDITMRPATNKKEISIVGSRETGVGSVFCYYNGSNALIGDLVEGISAEGYWSN